MTVAPWRDPALSVEERAEALLADLAPEEKIAQLGSYWKRPEIGDAEGFAPMQSTFDEDRDPFEEAVKSGLGHITRAFGSAPLTSEEGVATLRRLQSAVVAGRTLTSPAPWPPPT
ncbi:MAG: hypothetical protein LOY01_00420 [Brachybacterium paraconglomeratum]|nr:hypothetical protein [Brachybacterium paraconglomeratum]